MSTNSTAHGPSPNFLLDPTKRPPPPAGLDLDETKQPLVIALALILWLVAVLSVVLRIVSRRIKNARLWLDDWIIIASVPFSTALVFSIAGYGVSKGLGKHLWVTPPDSLYAWAIVMLISQVTYPVVVVCFKWSILALYWRLFHFQRSIKILIGILAVVVFLWGLAVMLVPLLQCKPLYALWARFDPVNPLPYGSYHCRVPQKQFLMWNAIPTLVTDVLLLVLPIPYTWGLRLPKAKKIGIVATFCLGSFILVVSIVRLNYLVRGVFPGPDITWNFTQMMLWFVAEMNVGIVCACLPLLLPILTKLRRGTVDIESQNKEAPGPTTHVEEGNIFPLEELTSHGQSFAEVKASNGNDTNSKGGMYSHYRADDGSERSLRRPDEESVEVSTIDDSRVSDVNGILVTTEISVQK